MTENKKSNKYIMIIIVISVYIVAKIIKTLIHDVNDGIVYLFSSVIVAIIYFMFFHKKTY